MFIKQFQVNNHLDNLTLEQYNAIENQRDRKNAWGVAREVANRVDSAPCMGEHLKATTAIEPSEGFRLEQGIPGDVLQNTKLDSKTEDPWILLYL